MIPVFNKRAIYFDSSRLYTVFVSPRIYARNVKINMLFSFLFHYARTFKSQRDTNYRLC